MTTKSQLGPCYASSSGDQAIIFPEDANRPAVAVVYDRAHASVFASAPKMAALLDYAIEQYDAIPESASVLDSLDLLTDIIERARSIKEEA